MIPLLDPRFLDREYPIYSFQEKIKVKIRASILKIQLHLVFSKVIKLKRKKDKSERSNFRKPRSANELHYTVIDLLEFQENLNGLRTPPP